MSMIGLPLVVYKSMVFDVMKPISRLGILECKVSHMTCSLADLNGLDKVNKDIYIFGVGLLIPWYLMSWSLFQVLVYSNVKCLIWHVLFLIWMDWQRLINIYIFGVGFPNLLCMLLCVYAISLYLDSTWTCQSFDRNGFSE